VLKIETVSNVGTVLQNYKPSRVRFTMRRRRRGTMESLGHVIRRDETGLFKKYLQVNWKVQQKREGPDWDGWKIKRMICGS
jgi:hypothetical protein